MGTRAAKAALFALALVAVPAVAQPPGSQPRPLTGGNLVPGAAQPNTQGGAAQPGALPLPPGYRPRTPPPQAQPQAQPARTSSNPLPGGSAGTVMYFQKPADALTATGGGLPAGADDGVAQLGARTRVTSGAVPDVPPAPVRPAPTYAQPPAVHAPLDVPTRYTAQPGDMKSTSEKKQNEIPPVDAKDVQLPARDKIFGMVFNDAELERAIMDFIRRQQKESLPNVVIPAESLVFPPLPEVSPRGAVYQPKTLTYQPRTMQMEPGYVVHRRLHFEERNAERQGWDLGPLSTLVGAAHFYRHVLTWPYHLAAGCTTGFWDTNAGKCVPGSPSPYYLYPPGLSLTGTAAEAGIITGAAFLFP